MKTEEKSEKSNSTPEIAKPAEKEAPKKQAPSKLKGALRQVGIWVLCLLIGALAVALPLYLPTRSQLQQALSDVERLSEIERQYNELLPKYQLTKDQATLYKTLSDALILRAAVENKDTTKINQQLRYLEDDLSQLEVPDFPEILQRLQGQFSKVKSAIPSESEKALAELDEFYKDLLLLADNLR